MDTADKTPQVAGDAGDSNAPEATEASVSPENRPGRPGVPTDPQTAPSERPEAQDEASETYTAAPLANLDLDEIAARAAALYEYATVTDPDGQAALEQLTDTDVPALLADIGRLAAALAQECARAQDALNLNVEDGREVCADCGKPVADGPCAVHSPDAVFQRQAQEAARLRAQRDQARQIAVTLEQETARLETELARAQHPSYSNRHVWSVWREEQPVHAFYTTENDARQGSIDCWEEDDPSCPDYSWRPDGGRLELVVGGEAGGVYISRHDVFGTLGAALLWAHAMDDHDLSMFLDDLVSAALGRWRSDPDIPNRTVLADIEKACTDWREPGRGLRSDEAKAGESQ